MQWRTDVVVTIYTIHSTLRNKKPSEKYDLLNIRKITPGEKTTIIVNREQKRIYKKNKCHIGYEVDTNYKALECVFDNGTWIVIEKGVGYFYTTIGLPLDKQMCRFNDVWSSIRPKKETINDVEYSYPLYCYYSKENVTPDDDRGIRICEGNPDILWHYNTVDGHALYYRSGFLIKSELIDNCGEPDFELIEPEPATRSIGLCEDDYERFVKKLDIPPIP